jgi:Tfp pilus assembly protein PilN
MMVRRINLVPPTERRRTQTDMGLLVVLAAGVAVLGGMAFSYFYFSGVASDREMELALLQTERLQVEAQLAALSEYEALEAEVQANEQMVQQLYAGRTLVSEVLGDLSLVVPKEVWFDTLDLTAPPLSQPTAAPAAAGAAAPAAVPASTGPTVGTMTFAGSTFTFEDVADLLVRLDQVSSVSKVTLGTADSVDIGEEPVKSFDINTEIENTQPADAPLPITEVEVKG